MRCLKEAAPKVEVQAREVDVPGADEAASDELESPYVHGETLDVAAWAQDAFALAAPAKVLCKEDCMGLCPECAVRPERGRAGRGTNIRTSARADSDAEPTSCDASCAD